MSGRKRTGDSAANGDRARRGGSGGPHPAPRQLPALLEASLLIRGESALNAGELAFQARILAQATLPHSDPGDVASFGREAGALRLVIQPGPEVGLPYGSIPRLVMAWLTTEAVRTKSRRIVLGDTLSAFMAELDLVPTGGRWGSGERCDGVRRWLWAAGELWWRRVVLVAGGVGVLAVLLR